MLPWYETAVQCLQLDSDGGKWITTHLPPASDARIERKAQLKVESGGTLAQRLGATHAREEELKARTPLRVALTGDDHAGAYVYLASGRARGVTGTVLHSDGGIGIR